jgi:hypothetical protein
MLRVPSPSWCRCSPDRGDAVVMCLAEGERAWRNQHNGGLPTQANVGYAGMKRR